MTQPPVDLPPPWVPLTSFTVATTDGVTRTVQAATYVCEDGFYVFRDDSQREVLRMATGQVDSIRLNYPV